MTLVSDTNGVVIDFAWNYTPTNCFVRGGGGQHKIIIICYPIKYHLYRLSSSQLFQLLPAMVSALASSANIINSPLGAPTALVIFRGWAVTVANLWGRNDRLHHRLTRDTHCRVYRATWEIRAFGEHPWLYIHIVKENMPSTTLIVTFCDVVVESAVNKLAVAVIRMAYLK